MGGNPRASEVIKAHFSFSDRNEFLLRAVKKGAKPRIDRGSAHLPARPAYFQVEFRYPVLPACQPLSTSWLSPFSPDTSTPVLTISPLSSSVSVAVPNPQPAQSTRVLPWAFGCSFAFAAKQDQTRQVGTSIFLPFTAAASQLQPPQGMLAAPSSLVNRQTAASLTFCYWCPRH